MDQALKEYLEWRFRQNNHPKYYRYAVDWIEGIMSNPDYNTDYLREEMKHLYERGEYTG